MNSARINFTLNISKNLLKFPSLVKRPIRFCCHESLHDQDCEANDCKQEKHKGVVFGVCGGKCPQLSHAAKCFDTNGTLEKALTAATGGKMVPGRCYVFYDINPDYHAVVVVNTPQRDKDSEEMEIVDTRKEGIRAGVAAGCKLLQSIDIHEIHVETFGDGEAAAEGALLSTFMYQDYKCKKKPSPKIELFDTKSDEVINWCKGRTKADAQNWARALMTTPANKMTPTVFADEVNEKLCALGVDVYVHDEQWAADKNMNAFLAVAKGSTEKPKFLEIHYKGAKDKTVQPFVLVGKGVTFDSGGICLKPPSGMDIMRADMGGAACVVATIYALANLKTRANVIGLIPLTENMPSEKATKPGDIVFAMNGKSICIEDTDAEGRLILADALCYSKEFCPAWILDVATLTGSMWHTLGSAACGVYSNNNHLFKMLQKAGGKTGDRVWRLPLWNHYKNQMIGYSAFDINNKPKQGGGYSCTAASFLKEFIPKKTKWVHMDTANVRGNGNSPYISPEGMSGRPTRTIIEFISMAICEPDIY